VFLKWKSLREVKEEECRHEYQDQRPFEVSVHFAWYAKEVGEYDRDDHEELRASLISLGHLKVRVNKYCEFILHVSHCRKIRRTKSLACFKVVVDGV
jgi:hypothetical protein